MLKVKKPARQKPFFDGVDLSNLQNKLQKTAYWLWNSKECGGPPLIDQYLFFAAIFQALIKLLDSLYHDKDSLKVWSLDFGWRS